MFRTFARKFLPNPFDRMLKKCAKKGGKKILLFWNRGLGDIALGLFAMVHRIKEYIPDAEITFLTRENLREGFSMLEGVTVIADKNWKRKEKAPDFDRKGYDLIVENPSPTDWVFWQRGHLIPKLKWDPNNDSLYDKFALPKHCKFIGLQVATETGYGLWRNWPENRWLELLDRLEKIENVMVVLFGVTAEVEFKHKNIIDLRGKTTLLELISLIKNRFFALVLPDSGIASILYYLNVSFPIKLITLWADPNHGILKQNVPSPNSQLIHLPLIAKNRDLHDVTADQVLEQLFPILPLKKCLHINTITDKYTGKTGCIILAGGQGTRLNFEGPKGLFPIKGKPLFQWFMENAPQQKIVFAIMTSPLNHDDTVAFFKKHNYFDQEVHFFQQEMLAFKGLSIKGPNGNGDLFRSFAQSGLLDLFVSKNISLLSIIPVDNYKAKAFDERFLAYARNNEVTIKCVERLETDGSMGALVEKKGKIAIMEYMEMDHSFRYSYSNIGQFAFSMSFMQKMASIDLPLHWVEKKITIGNNSVTVWKGEKFIFDAFPYANSIAAICVDRKLSYAPLKSMQHLEAIEQGASL